MIRITGGRFRGRQLHCPPGKNVRPTTAFVRESLFSILGPRLNTARFLDLFAGCGIVGFEALSRGADQVVAVENNGRHLKMLKQNQESLQLSPDTYQIVGQDVFTWLSRQNRNTAPFDIIFLDPPYALNRVEDVVTACFEKELLDPHGWLVWEHADKAPLPELLRAERFDQRKYGLSTLSFFRWSTSPAGPESPSESPAPTAP